MNIELPTIPAGVLVLLALVAPYAVAALNGALSFVTKPWQKKAVAIVVALVLTAVVLAFYYAYTGDVIPQWPVLVLLAIVVAQASYTLVTKSTATAVENAISGESSVRARAVKLIADDPQVIDAARAAVDNALAKRPIASGETVIVNLNGIVREGQQLPRPAYGAGYFDNGLSVDSDGIAHVVASSPDGVDGSGLAYVAVKDA